MFRLLKALPLTLALAALSIVATSCGSNNAQARFVNAIQDTNDYGSGVLDVEVNGTKHFTAVAFPGFSASTYVSVPTGTDTIAGLESPGDTTTVFSLPTPSSLSSGTPYTLVATGFATGANGANVLLKAYPDTNTAPTVGNVNFRVINASPDSPGSVDVYIEQAPFTGTLSCPATNCIQAVAYGTASSYLTLPYNSGGGGYVLYVCTSGNPTPTWINGQPFAAGSLTTASIRTLVLTDQANGSQMNSSALILDDLN